MRVSKGDPRGGWGGGGGGKARLLVLRLLQSFCNSFIRFYTFKNIIASQKLKKSSINSQLKMPLSY